MHLRDKKKTRKKESETRKKRGKKESEMLPLLFSQMPDYPDTVFPFVVVKEFQISRFL